MLRLFFPKKIFITAVAVFISILVFNSTLFAYSSQNFNEQKVEKAYFLAKNWLINNITKKGGFYYLYNADEDEYSKNNNDVRQLMASRVLAELSQNDLFLQKKHKKNLNYIFSRWYKEKDDYAYVYFDKKAKLGAMAMMLRTLVYSPFFEDYAEEAEKLANGILFLQNEDGSFEPWLIEPDYSYNKDYVLTFYSGEAILALVDYYLKTKDGLYLQAAQKAQDFYLKKYVENLEENYYPAYVPWHTQALNKLYKITEERRYAGAVFVLNDELLKIQNTTGEPDERFLGRFYDPNFLQYGNPHAASDGVYTEGLAYALEIARMVKDEEREKKYEKALDLALGNLYYLQVDEEEAKDFKFPEKVLGGVRVKVDDNRIRIDNTQHFLDALTKLMKMEF